MYLFNQISVHPKFYNRPCFFLLLFSLFFFFIKFQFDGHLIALCHFYLIWSCDTSKDAYWDTELISIQFSNILYAAWLASEKPCYSFVFLLPVLSIFKTIEQISIFEFSVPICVFWCVKRLYLKRIFFNPYYSCSITLKITWKTY